MIKIGLLGFDFKAPNKGCEALSYAFIEMLSDISNESMEIHVFSYGELGDIPRQYPKFSFVWHRLNMKNPGFLIKMKQILMIANVYLTLLMEMAFLIFTGRFGMPIQILQNKLQLCQRHH